MSDEQPTSWRDRFFGSTPAETPAADSADPAADEQAEAEQEVTYDSAELAPDDAEVAAVSVGDHDEHQPLVEHDAEARQDPFDAEETAPAERERRAPDNGSGDDASIEPTVIAPSTLRGPSHSAAHPDDARGSVDAAHGDAAESSLEQHPDTAGAHAVDDAAPPALVEPRRPSFGLRRRADGEPAGAGGGGDGAAAGAAAGGLAVGGAAAASRAGERDAGAPEFSEPAPTQAMDAQHAGDQPTQAMDAQPAGDQPTQAMDAQQTDTGTATRVLDAQTEPGRTERFGIIRDEVPASSIPVDDETARAAAGGGTPIVLVEEPMPPRRKGARAVGFAVALLATLIFAIVFAAAYLAVGFLFDRDFALMETLQTVWLRPSYLLPVVIFFLAYWIVTLIVNRAGWWAHVLGAFIVALLVYAAHIGGAFMEEQGGWGGYTALPGIDPQALGQLLLAPLSVLAFVIAREVPVWVGGIVARRGRKAREWNRQSMDEFNAQNAERLDAYERARG
ncbi:hypothetical protein SAMN04487783_0738 [Agrococcus baldri]|uniref:Uncharacterized protein n=1 Tax=Agrococcus baldri TaxID=153730 RepID=A0AA94HL14_9MICO|nr:hypothetical protein [Agrococcus baldri]SFS03343.1 hypothetical protein SAMN04487783_0738 [Agrococcus baldri]